MDNELQLLRDALNLLRSYNPYDTSSTELYKRRGYKGRPLYFYLPLLLKYASYIPDSTFQQNYQNAFRKTTTSARDQIKKFLKLRTRQQLNENELDPLDKFLLWSQRDHTTIDALSNVINSHGFYAQEELRHIQELDNLPETPQRTQGYSQLMAQQISKLGQTSLSQETQERYDTVNELQKKISKYGKYMLTEEGRKKLLENPEEFLDEEDKKKKLRFSKEELDIILKSGLLKGAEGGEKKESVTIKEQREALNKAALELIEERKKLKLPTQSSTEAQPTEAPSTETPLPSSPKTNKTGVIISQAKSFIQGPLLNKAKWTPLYLAKTGQFFSPVFRQIFSLGRRGGKRFLTKVGKESLAFSKNILDDLPNVFSPKVPVKGIMVVLLIVLSSMSLIFLTPSGSDLSQSGQPGHSSSGQISSNIASCKFTRGQENPSSVSFKSPLLLSYFQEASQLSGVPAVILAAVTRVESPGSVSLTDDALVSFCPESKTGALGIMQIQPPWTDPSVGAYDAAAVGLGASFLGKTAETLTRDDFCNVKENITIGAGFIIKKMEYKYGDNNNTWNPAWTNDKNAIYTLADSYYGCLNYGGSNPNKCEGPFNYGDDLWNSIQNCRVNNIINALTPVSCPVPGGKITTTSYNAAANTGHCSPVSYEFTCEAACPTTGRRAKAIDIATGGPNGKDVILPTIQGQTVNWTLIQPLCAGAGTYPHCYDSNGGSGFMYTFEATVPGSTDKWYIQFIHMLETPLQVNQSYPSGTIVGKTNEDHVHTTIGKNITNPLSSGSISTDCDPGWLASDFMCNQ